MTETQVFRKGQKVWDIQRKEVTKILEVKRDSGIAKSGKPYTCFWYRTANYTSIFPTFRGTSQFRTLEAKQSEGPK